VSTTVNLDQALTDEQFRLIGVELRMYSATYGQQELAMFGTSLVLPRLRSIPRNGGYYSDSYTPNITLHTTLGDYNLIGHEAATW
jgi:hypothetical protein